MLPLLRARGGVLDAHLGDVHLGHVDQGVHPDVTSDRRLGHGRRQVPGGHGPAEVDLPTAAENPQPPGPRRVGRLSALSAQPLSTGGCGRVCLAFWALDL